MEQPIRENVQAAFLRVKLRHLDEWNKDRNRIADRYLNEIHNEKIMLPEKSQYCDHVYHIFAVRTPYRTEMEKCFKEHEIGFGTHYPIPIYKQPAYADAYKQESYPVADEISESEISLPMFYGMTDAQIDKIVGTLNSF